MKEQRGKIKKKRKKQNRQQGDDKKQKHSNIPICMLITYENVILQPNGCLMNDNKQIRTLADAI